MAPTSKIIRRALITAKNVASKMDSTFSRVPLKKGGRTPMFTGGVPEGEEPKLPIKIDEGSSPEAPHTILDLDGNTNYASGPLRAGPHSQNIKLPMDPLPPQQEKAMMDHLEANPVDSVVAPSNLHRIHDKNMIRGQIARAHKYLKPGGKAYFVINQGRGSGVPGLDEAKKYHTNKPAVFYMNEMKKVFPRVSVVENVLVGHKD